MDMQQHCISDGATIFFNTNRAFQDNAVNKWNNHTEDVAGSLFLGFVGVKEDSRKNGCGTIGLDLLMKGGTIKEREFGIWSLAQHYKCHRNYVFDNRKSIENLTGFAKVLHECRFSLKLKERMPMYLRRR